MLSQYFVNQLFNTPAGCDWSPACLAFLAGAAAAGASLPPPFDGVPLTTLLELGEDCMVSDNSLTMLMQFQDDTVVDIVLNIISGAQRVNAENKLDSNNGFWIFL